MLYRGDRTKGTSGDAGDATRTPQLSVWSVVVSMRRGGGRGPTVLCPGPVGGVLGGGLHAHRTPARLEVGAAGRAGVQRKLAASPRMRIIALDWFDRNDGDRMEAGRAGS